MASRGEKSGGDFVLESRHLVGLFLLLVVIFGAVLTPGYLLGRSQYDSRLRAAVGKPPEAAPPTAGSSLKSKGKAESEQAAPSQTGSDWDFYHSAEPKTTEDHLQPPKKTVVAAQPAASKPAPAKPAAQVFHQALPARSVAPSNQKWVMVIDLTKCDGFGDCTGACNVMHFVFPMQEWIGLFEVLDNPAAGPYFLVRSRMQYDNSPCVRGCPVGGAFKCTDGIVIMDQERCMGCRDCMAQCPYSARSFNWGDPPHTREELSVPYSMEYNYPHRKGVAEKCIFCPQELRAGELPACVEKCTMGAIYFGDQYEDAVTNSKGETIQLSKITKQGAGFRQLEELGTDPRVYYLPAANRKYPAPGELKAAEKKS